MYITEDGLRLRAAIDMPEGWDETKASEGSGKKCPLVIVIHGFTGHMEETHITAVSRAMNRIGFATLRADMYGHGQSDGTFRDHTLYKWLTNALTLIDYARTLDFVSEICLCGHSQGGLTAILAAALKHDQIRALIPLSPANMIPEGARRGELLGLQFDPEQVPEELSAWDDRTLGGNYVRVAQTIHVEEAIRKYRGPVLIVHGDADESVPVQCAIDAAEMYENARLVLIPGDTHCYDFHLEMVTEAVSRWLKELYFSDGDR